MSADDRVEGLLPRAVPVEERVAPAAPADDLEAGVGRPEFPDGLLIFGDRTQAEQGDGAELLHGARRMAVGVDEARKDQLAAQVRDPRALADKAGGAIVRPDIEEHAVPDGDGLGPAPGAVHGVNRAVLQDEVGFGPGHALRRAGRNDADGDEDGGLNNPSWLHPHVRPPCRSGSVPPMYSRAAAGCQNAVGTRRT